MILSAISNYVPKIGIASPQQAVKNLTRIAVPVITLVATSMINGAQAVRYTECRYAECIDNCSKIHDVHDLAKSLCYMLCNFLGEKG